MKEEVYVLRKDKCFFSKLTLFNQEKKKEKILLLLYIYKGGRELGTLGYIYSQHKRGSSVLTNGL